MTAAKRPKETLSSLRGALIDARVQNSHLRDRQRELSDELHRQAIQAASCSRILRAANGIADRNREAITLAVADILVAIAATRDDFDDVPF